MRSVFVLALLGGLSLIAAAVPTGLNAMPTANVLGLGEARFEYESAGSGKLYVPANAVVYGTQTGFILGLEGGLDEVGGATRANGKWRLKGEGIITPALAIGIQNLGGDLQYYGVATKSFILAAVHAGLLRDTDTDTNVTMLGANANLGPLVVKVDKLNGGALDRTAVGASLRLGTITVSGTSYDFDNAPRERTFSVSYTYRAF
ncbi:MAG TPA: hypothetical protein PK794_00530 [Armatimonadota bacterium]|nr:hypothetical protein [Armatimonadota bacterium]